MRNKIFSRREWLNRDKSASTGSVAAYHGPARWTKGDDETITFLEVADCHVKARLHQTYADTPEDFIKKLQLLRDVIGEFIDFLDDEYRADREEAGSDQST